MEISLKHEDMPETYLLQWNQTEGTLEGDAEVIRHITLMADWALEDGYVGYPDIIGSTYPVTDPLKKADELALVCASLGYYSPQLPITYVEFESDNDGWVRDEHGNIVDQVLF